VVLNNIFIGPRRGIDQDWVGSTNLVYHLEHSIWTSELEHAIEAFSLSAYLNWLDYNFKPESIHDTMIVWYKLYNAFPEEFLHYLESQVSNPHSQSKFELQLLILIRENLTFITTICCVTWSTLTLPSRIPQLERNSAS